MHMHTLSLTRTHMCAQGDGQIMRCVGAKLFTSSVLMMLLALRLRLLKEPAYTRWRTVIMVTCKLIFHYRTGSSECDRARFGWAARPGRPHVAAQAALHAQLPGQGQECLLHSMRAGP